MDKLKDKQVAIFNATDDTIKCIVSRVGFTNVWAWGHSLVGYNLV